MEGPTGDPRADAALALVEAMSGRSTSTEVIDRFIASYPPDRRKDAALLHQLVMGVLRRRAALVKVVSPLVRRPWAKVDPEIREILLCMAYQSLFLTRIPSHARVSASVESARRIAGKRAAGFVNAVGRSLERETARGDPLDRLGPADLHSVPDVVLDCMGDVLARGPEPDEIEALSREAPATFRVNPAAGTREDAIARLVEAGIEAAPTSLSPLGIVVIGSGPVRSTGLVPRVLVPQDEASQLVVGALAPAAGERIVDLCAGNGVKTAQILGMAPGADVVAVDRDERKLEACMALCRESGLTVPHAVTADARRLPDGMKGTAHAVLVDAPCSGIGTLVRRPEVRYLRRRADFEKASRLQAGLLRAGIDLLVPGGRLVYAVCSFAPEEGPGVVEGVLRHSGDVRREPLGLEPPIGTADGAALTLPWRDRMDGFYFAKLTKTS